MAYETLEGDLIYKNEDPPSVKYSKQKLMEDMQNMYNLLKPKK